MKLLFSRLVAFFALLLILATTVLGDTIRLKDGTVLKGKVVSYNQRKFSITVYIGGAASQYSVAVEDVESVEFDADVMAGSRIQTQVPPLVEAPLPNSATQQDVIQSPSNPVEPRNSTATTQINPTSRVDPDAGIITTIAEKTVSVAAASDWTSTEIRVQKGQRVVISANGEIDLGNGQQCSPEGIASNDVKKLLLDRPTGALIGVVGDDNDDFIFVGRSTEFVSKHNGILFLSINEGNLKDNAGAFVARVRVLSNR